MKIRVQGDAPEPTEDQLAGLLAALPGPDKRLTGGGSDFTVWAWYKAPDAPASIQAAGAAVRAAAERQGMGPLHVIRAHAASIEGRSTPFIGVAARVGRPDEWTIYFRVAAAPGGEPATPATLEAIAQALDRPNIAVSFGGDREKFLLDDGRGVVIRFWVEGRVPSEAFRSARQAVLDALAVVGLGDWTIVRMQAATAAARLGDMFPGVDRRQPGETEETR